MRRRSTSCALGALIAGLTACSGGSPSSATIGELSAPAVAGGDVALSFTLTDARERRVSIEIVYSVDGGRSWRVGTVASGETEELATSARGERHEVEWDSVADVGFRTPSAEVRVRLVDHDDDVARATLEGGDDPRVLAARVAHAGSKKSIKLENLPHAADRVEAYLYYLGALDAEKIAIAQTHDLVILDPSEPTVTREAIADIQDGVDPDSSRDDVIVLGYVNVGQDRRTVGLSGAQMLADPRFVGDATGPRVDPRGPNADGDPLTGIAPLGAASAASGYASWYLDDNSVDNNGIGDGVPDRSGVTGACYVNAGDPKWFDVVDAMRSDGPDALPGLREVLTLDHGAGFGCDGVFMDRLDTCAPNSFTGPGDSNQAEFEWTAPGFGVFVRKVRTTYPKHVMMQNRGLFFFDPDRPHYPFSTRPDVDFVMFASYRLDADQSRTFDAYTFANNKHNIVPRLQVEANRPDGFQVLSIGHAEGPGLDPRALTGQSTLGVDTLRLDVVEAQSIVGFRHYLTDRGTVLVNDFVRRTASYTDSQPPTWTSTYNAAGPTWPTPPPAPQPRIGVQQVVAGARSVTVRWDVARDLHPVHYRLYYGKNLRFAGDKVKGSKRLDVQPKLGAGYAFGVGAGVYPYEVTVPNLNPKHTWQFCVRAIDSKGNEDANRVVLAATPLDREVAIEIDGRFEDWQHVAVAMLDDDETAPTSAGPDWREIKLYSDADNLYVYFRSDHAFNLDGSPSYPYSRTLICIDVDADPATGYSIGTLGTEIKLAGDALYRQRKGVFADQFLQNVDVNPTTGVTECELAIPLTRLDAVYGWQANRIRIVLVNDEIWDSAPDSGYHEFRIVR